MMTSKQTKCSVVSVWIQYTCTRRGLPSASRNSEVFRLVDTDFPHMCSKPIKIEVLNGSRAHT